jgi:two-component system LytT family sensor kinase
MRPFASISRRSILLPLTLACCWSLWEIANGVGWALKAPGKLEYIIRYTAVDGLVGLVVCGFLFLVYDRVRDRLALGPFLLVVAPLCFAAALLWHGASALTMWRVGWNDKLYLDTKSLLIGGGLMDGITLALFSLLFFAVDHWLQLREQREKAREATALAHQAQLQMLRYQLNPHFLFNALNSIRAMILREPERARQIVTELSEFLRYSLNGRGHESTVGEEMQAIESYLVIQRIRFEEKLTVTVHVDPELHEFVLPCFLVHPLVENAVKHGMETSEPPLRVEIEVAAGGPGLRIRVSNTGRLVPAAPAVPGGARDGTGTGLKNVAQRLELAFPGRHTFSVVEREGWVHAEIVLRPAAKEDAP